MDGFAELVNMTDHIDVMRLGLCHAGPDRQRPACALDRARMAGYSGRSYWRAVEHH